VRENTDKDRDTETDRDTHNDTDRQKTLSHTHTQEHFQKRSSDSFGQQMKPIFSQHQGCCKRYPKRKQQHTQTVSPHTQLTAHVHAHTHLHTHAYAYAYAHAHADADADVNTDTHTLSHAHQHTRRKQAHKYTINQTLVHSLLGPNCKRMLGSKNALAKSCEPRPKSVKWV